MSDPSWGVAKAAHLRFSRSPPVRLHTIPYTFVGGVFCGEFSLLVLAAISNVPVCLFRPGCLGRNTLRKGFSWNTTVFCAPTTRLQVTEVPWPTLLTGSKKARQKPRLFHAVRPSYKLSTSSGVVWNHSFPGASVICRFLNFKAAWSAVSSSRGVSVFSTSAMWGSSG